MPGTYLNPCQRYGADPFNDAIIDSPGNVRNKLALVQIRYGLDRLCDDPSEIVRAAVAAIGYVKPSPQDAEQSDSVLSGVPAANGQAPARVSRGESGGQDRPNNRGAISQCDACAERYSPYESRTINFDILRDYDLPASEEDDE